MDLVVDMATDQQEEEGRDQLPPLLDDRVLWVLCFLCSAPLISRSGRRAVSDEDPGADDRDAPVVTKRQR
jgi:hypothetical protein